MNPVVKETFQGAIFFAYFTVEAANHMAQRVQQREIEVQQVNQVKLPTKMLRNINHMKLVLKYNTLSVHSTSCRSEDKCPL